MNPECELDSPVSKGGFQGSASSAAWSSKLKPRSLRAARPSFMFGLSQRLTKYFTIESLPQGSIRWLSWRCDLVGRRNVSK